MRTLAFALALPCAACQVYGPSLLIDASADAGGEACATQCSGTCADLQSDKNNCGTCGKQCETGCTSGLCTPTLLASGLAAPHGILVNASSLYVAGNAAINVQVMNKLDGTGLKNFFSGVLQPDRFATDGTILYWTDDTNIPTNGGNPGGSIWEASFVPPTPSCAGPACYYVRDLPSPYAIAVQGGTMFFTTLDATNKSGGGCAPTAWTNSVLSCPTGGCGTLNCNASGGPTVIASNQTKLAGIAADTKNVYWADFGGNEVRYCPQPSCAGGPIVLAQVSGPYDVVSNGTTVYFSARTGGGLYSCPATGCTGKPTQLASGLTNPFLLAVDNKTLYVTQFSAGQIAACPLPDCAGGPITIAQNLKHPYDITTDSTYVYWSEEGSNGNVSTDGTVSKLRKL